MNPFERYSQLYDLTDPTDPIVAADIARGARWGYGKTDVHDHLPRLRELAQYNVLEIGVRFGASTAALLTGVEEKGGHVWSIDIEPCDFARSLFEGNPRWTFIRGDSKEVFVDLRHIDLLFIDGDHSYEGVLADLRLYGPLARTIALHDYHRWNSYAIPRAVGTYLKTGARQKKLYVYRESNGMAVLS